MQQGGVRLSHVYAHWSCRHRQHQPAATPAPWHAAAAVANPCPPTWLSRIMAPPKHSVHGHVLYAWLSHATPAHTGQTHTGCSAVPSARKDLHPVACNAKRCYLQQHARWRGQSNGSESLVSTCHHPCKPFKVLLGCSPFAPTHALIIFIREVPPTTV